MESSFSTRRAVVMMVTTRRQQGFTRTKTCTRGLRTETMISRSCVLYGPFAALWISSTWGLSPMLLRIVAQQQLVHSKVRPRRSGHNNSDEHGEEGFPLLAWSPNTSTLSIITRKGFMAHTLSSNHVAAYESE